MRSTHTAAAVVFGAATLAGPAYAMPIDPPQGPVPLDPATPAPLVQTGAPPDETSSGFDWSSAGIGAAGGVGAFAIVLAGSAGRRRRITPTPSTRTMP